jgi:hypothetical protein
MARGPFSTSNYFHSDTCALPAQPLTVAAWVWVRSLFATTQHILGCGTGTSNYYIVVQITSTNLVQTIMKTTTAVAVPTDVEITAGAWHLIGFNQESTKELTTYLNATPSPTSPLANNPSGFTDRMRVGTRPWLAPNASFDGYIGAMAVWNTARTDVFTEYAQRKDFRSYTSGLERVWYFDGFGPAIEDTPDDGKGRSAIDIPQVGVVPEPDVVGEGTVYGLHPYPFRPVPPVGARGMHYPGHYGGR